MTILLPFRAWLAAAALLLPSAVQAQKPALVQPRRPSPAFQLFGPVAAGAVAAEGNRVYCGLHSDGPVCNDFTGSPLLGGGSWPVGTSDQYVFNSGLQIAGIVAAAPGFAWSGDTVGAWVVDMRGPAEHTSSLTGIYDSRNGSDTANWPDAAWARDPTFFHPSLIGRPVVSLQDTWMRMWDGDTSLVTGRVHGMGLLIEQRTLQFTGPEGMQDVLFLLYRLTNITTGDPAKYQGLAASGHSAADIADIAAVGATWQRGMEARHNIAIPDSGYTLRDVYAAFTSDEDIGDATNNYATASLPFALALAYKSNFQEATWQFPADPFSGNFAAAPGFVGIKLLATPGNGALATFTTFANLFPEPANVRQGYQVFNGTASVATGYFGNCQYPPSRHLCFLTQAPSDQRTTQSTGPFTLPPGQSAVFALAYVFAPALLHNPGRPSYDLNQYLGNTTLTPGVPPGGDRLVQGLDTLRVIDAAIGWVSHADTDGSGAIEEDEVLTVRGSLLHKAQVAQALFDNGFARPEPPAAPDFLLVPGSNQVTIVWRPSPTEAAGDPYFAIASNQASALHDPNYRQFDVEGYRLWRGTDPEHLTLLRQWDYGHTTMADYTGDLWNGDYLDARGEYQCAPELGITASCPVAFASAPPYLVHYDVPITGAWFSSPHYPGLVQIPLGGRSRMANDSAQFARGALRVDRADTVFGRNARFEPLLDSEVPFAFTDTEVRNGVRYYYAVTAFDVNSLRSGPSSLESAVLVRAVTPRVASGQLAGGSIAPVEIVGSNGAVVPRAPMPTIDQVTGMFSGSMPPADVTLTVPSFEPALVSASGSVEFYVDSVIPGRGTVNAAQAYIPGTYYLRIHHARGTDTLAVPFNVGYLSAQLGTPDFEFATTFDAVPVDSTRAATYGGTGPYYLPGTVAFLIPGALRLTEWGRGDALADPSRSSFNGPRWWSNAANENTSHPNSGHCAPSNSSCAAIPPFTPTAGALAGVNRLMHVLGYNTVPAAPQRDFENITAHVVRAADFQVYWGPNGRVDSVMDRTHGVPVPFHAKIRASWGLLTQASFAAVTAANTRDGRNNVLTWADIYCVDPAPSFLGECGGEVAPLVNTATLSPIAAASSTTANLPTLPATGNGFIFYLNGHFFLMEMVTLPAAGTVWNARFYSGTVRTSGFNVAGNYFFVERPRPPAVPGLHLRVSYTGSTLNTQASVDSVMSRIHTVPDPYYGLGLSMTPGVPAQIRFVNVPSQAIIRIYSASGLLTALLTNNDATGGGEVIWDVKSRGGRLVASGVYFYHVEAPDGRTKIGRLTIVQ